MSPVVNKKPEGTSPPSEIWLAQQKVLKKRKRNAKPDVKKKKRKLETVERTHSFSASAASSSIEAVSSSTSMSTKGTSLKAVLRQMVLGQVGFSGTEKEAAKYIAIDCEMVGVGIDGKESSLARVSLVDFYGIVLLDEYVKQRERVVDYRTQWSGIRAEDLVEADSFQKVQRRVADLVKDKTIIGHALKHDLSALLLSHPGRLTRDTQMYAYKAEVCKSKRVALRVLVKQELDLTIQSGEHSSVTDARAALAIYRLHQQKFERVANLKRTFPSKALNKTAAKSDQRKQDVSSGLSTVTQTGKKKAKSCAVGPSQCDELEDYDCWSADDSWRVPSWMREPLDLSDWDI